jgi:prepilin-type N-terminal cleavage/methylation domain-containing protein
VRGFTLVELMVVVVIIAVMAVIAVPLFAARLQSRRVLQTAGSIADLYRGSRTRALARGAAILVSMDPSNGAFQVLEGVQGTSAATAAGRATCANLPTQGCMTNNWGNVLTATNVGTARVVDAMTSSNTNTSMTLPDGTLASSSVSVCFSPGGRTYYNTSGTWTANAWQPLGTVLKISVSDTHSPPLRTYDLIIMPNGTARLAL